MTDDKYFQAVLYKINAIKEFHKNRKDNMCLFTYK